MMISSHRSNRFTDCGTIRLCVSAILFSSIGCLAQTYQPGALTVTENGLKLSTGLTSRIIATTDQPVQLDTGGQSTDPFHAFPDGAAVILNPDGSGSYAYVSNSEVFSTRNQGGVGTIYFDSSNQITGYTRNLRESTHNCAGGPTWYGTWMSCEEDRDLGGVWEVDPWANTAKKTVAGSIPVPGDFHHHLMLILHFGHWPSATIGAAYENAAYDRRDPTKPVFYFSIHDARNGGPIMRYIPDAGLVASNQDRKLLYEGNAQREFLVADPNTSTFTWTSDYGTARKSALDSYLNGEGLLIKDGKIYMTSNNQKRLYIFDIDAMTYESVSTLSGNFQSQPDQLAFLPGTDELFFAEDAGSDAEFTGVHVRDSTGKFYTVIDADTVQGENSGIAFSPDKTRLFVAYQQAGRIYEIRRTDNLAFDAAKLPPVYHA